MKVKLLFLIITLTVLQAYSQNASTYFPASTGYKWYFKVTPLDSNNNPVTTLTTYRIDSFAVVENYQQLLASIVLSKKNLISLTQNVPYTDSGFYNFQTTNAWEYLKITNMLDSTLFDTLGFYQWIKSLEKWYNSYRFAQTVNSLYTLFQKDTTISINGTNYPMRIKVEARRLNDQSVSTVNGTYTAKKFVHYFNLSYMVLGIFPIKIFEKPDTSWIAQDVWFIKKHSPSIKFNLDTLGLPYSISIPGDIMELVQPTIIKNISSIKPENFLLEQNHPNPFNPSTIIRFHIPVSVNTSLIIYNITGRETETLIKEFLIPGIYEIKWDASKHPSGTYFCKLSAGRFSEVRKMSLIK